MIIVYPFRNPTDQYHLGCKAAVKHSHPSAFGSLSGLARKQHRKPGSREVLWIAKEMHQIDAPHTWNVLHAALLAIPFQCFYNVLQLMLAYACICTCGARQRESSGHSYIIFIDIHRWTILLSEKNFRAISFCRAASSLFHDRAHLEVQPQPPKEGVLQHSPKQSGFLSLPKSVKDSYGQVMWASHDTTPGRAIVALCHEETYKSSRRVQSCSAFNWRRWKRRFNSNNIVLRHVWTGNMAALKTSEGKADGTCARWRLNRTLWVEEMALWDIDDINLYESFTQFAKTVTYEGQFSQRSLPLHNKMNKYTKYTIYSNRKFPPSRLNMAQRSYHIFFRHIPVNRHVSRFTSSQISGTQPTWHKSLMFGSTTVNRL